MNIKQMAIGIVWLGFAIFTVVVFLHDGKAAFALPFDSLTNTAGMIDLLRAYNDDLSAFDLLCELRRLQTQELVERDIS